ncbi:N,N-dimethylformamidase beta subunit family domain-containing protein [Limobrevibacterium gyesilva]|uniref:N,N-dimethylformamidase large subunit n=1 Tax=Limobrevibacterium gyesilva TaxID=2991712 RepID=A0AA41YS37_9PROT|nr:N,N-dimethylformamidase beta subunit family domain-containing protein [Limobrevibacterium gyesilva]MCW3475568.1 N,N-dimethylformamidase large subunit [Limobrevibacterium gyesilva]
MKNQELPITGYLDRFSHRPGERFSAHVSLRDPGAYRARLVRVIGGDANPAGPGLRLADLSHVFARELQGRRQAIRLGSHGIVDHGPVRAAGAACTWTALVWTAIPQSGGTVLAEEGGGAAVALAVGAAGACASLAWPGGAVRVETAVPLQPRRWYRLWLSADPATGRVVVGQRALGDDAAVAVPADAPGISLPSGGVVLFAAEHAVEPRGHFTGKIEDPAIIPGFHATWPEALVMPDGGALAAWDFADGIGSQSVTDTGPQGCHGRLVNLPTRAVVGARWSGREMCWRHAPRDYAAIHFHDDDLDDCGWEADFDWTVPDDLPSGAYALHLSCAGGEDWLPLYVLPRRAGPFAKVAFLASTFTYQAYANHARGNADAAYLERAQAWGAYPHNPDQYPIYGRSTYNRHSDNSGIAFSSRRRPVLTMRPGFMTFNDPRGSGLRHYPADTHLLAWMEAKGIAFDVITDEDLDDEGPALLAPYRVVLTGSHPEYHTANTLDALQAHTQHGGRLCYLGGNGFYWRIARDRDRPHMIELRRAEGGIRAWAAEPGEYYHQIDGQYGGLWRRNRRPPQMLAGVGFSGQGRFEGTYYRRLPASFDPAFAWMFAGVDGDTIGDYGLSGGGAAGFELDRADPVLGTPPQTVILARSENPPASFVTVPEELLSHLATVTGEPPAELMRGEIVYFDTPSGGAVFAVGSITFCGSLWREGPDGGGFTGPVSRLLENVVRRFSGES